MIGSGRISGSLLLMLGVVGIANTIVDVAAFTLLQRAVPDERSVARVFGVLQSVCLARSGSVACSRQRWSPAWVLGRP